VLCFFLVQQLEFSWTFIQTYFALMHHAQGRNEGRQGGHNSPGANSLWGRWITAGAPNYCWRRRKVPTMSQALSSIQ